MAEDLVNGRNEAHGMWWPAGDVDAAGASGRLDWNNRRAPRLLLLNPPIAAAVDVAELWFGTLAHHGRATLVGAADDGGTYDRTYQEALRGDYALLGVHLDDRSQKWARRMVISHPLLPEVFKRPSATHLSSSIGTRARTFEIDDGLIEWSTDDVEIKIFSPLYQRIGGTSIDLHSHESIICLVAAEDQSVDWWIDEWLIPLARLLPLAASKPGVTRWVRFHEEAHPPDGESEHGGVALLAQGIGNYDPPEADKFERLEPTLLVDLDGSIFLAMLERVRTVMSEHPVPLELAGQLFFGRDRPLFARYLDVARALERFHSDHRSQGPLSAEEHGAARADAIAELKRLREDDQIEPEIAKFLKKSMPSRSTFGLDRRLVHLIREWTPPGTDSIEDKAGEFAAIRNSIAHGTPYEGDMELRDAYRYVVQLLRAVLLLDPPPPENSLS